MDVVHLFGGEVQKMFEESGSIGGGFCPRLDDYGTASSVIRALSVEGYVEHERRVILNIEFEAQRKLLSQFVHIREERRTKKEARVEKVLLLFRCSMKGKGDKDELAFVRYMKYVAPLDEVDEAPKCGCHQWATSGSGEKGDDIKRGESKELTAAGKSFEVIPFQSNVSAVHVV